MIKEKRKKKVSLQKRKGRRRGGEKQLLQFKVFSLTWHNTGTVKLPNLSSFC
jgi:hypothetical protein